LFGSPQDLGDGEQNGMTLEPVNKAEGGTASNTIDVPKVAKKLISDRPAAHIDDPHPALESDPRLMGLKPEKDRWRNIARDWYSAGLAEQPGNGKLHVQLPPYEKVCFISLLCATPLTGTLSIA
jgi:hypothetical protein